MTNACSDVERLHALLDALSDDIVKMPDEMVLQIFAKDVDDDIERVDAILQSLLGDVKATPYEATAAALDASRKGSHSVLPKTPQARRTLLARIMGGDHPWSKDATFAFRDLEYPSKLTDEEVLGLLEDLAELRGEEGD